MSAGDGVPGAETGPGGDRGTGVDGRARGRENGSEGSFLSGDLFRRAADRLEAMGPLLPTHPIAGGPDEIPTDVLATWLRFHAIAVDDYPDVSDEIETEGPAKFARVIVGRDLS